MAGRIIWKNCTNTTHMPRSTQMARQRCQMKGSWSSARTSSEGCCWSLLVRFQGFKALGHSPIQPPNFKNEKTGTFQRSKTQGSHVGNRMWVLDFQCNFLSINSALVSSRFFQDRKKQDIFVSCGDLSAFHNQGEVECFSTLQSKCLCYKGAVRKSKAFPWQIGKRLCAGNIPQRSFVRVFLSLIPEIEKHADNGLLPDL